MIEGNTSQETVIDTDNITDEQADALGSFFLNDDEEPANADKSEQVEEDVEDEPETATDEDETEDEELEDGEDEEEEDGQEVAAISDPNTLVELPDGTKTTLQELQNGNLRQQDYTRKRQEDAEIRRELETKQSQTQELENILTQERQQMAAVLQQLMPQAPNPEMMQTDPIGYMQEKERFEAIQSNLQKSLQGNQQASQREQQRLQQEQANKLKKEQEAMYSAMPELRDPAKFNEFTSTVSTALTSEYGFTAAELNGIKDHRMLRVVADAVEYQKLKTAAPKTKKKLEGKPPVMKSSRKKSSSNAASSKISDRISKAQKTGDVTSVSDILGQLLT